MATVTKSDISESTSLSKGYQGVHHDTVTRGFWVTGLDTDSQDNLDAIDAVRTAIGEYHHSLTTLPLATISSRKAGPSVSRVVARYARSSISIPTVPAWMLAREQTGITNLRYFQSDSQRDSNGRPSGYLDVAPGSGSIANRFRSQTYPVSTRRISVPTILTYSPAETVEGLANCANTQPVTLAGCFNSGSSSSSDGYFEFPAYSLAFWSYSSDPVDIGGDILYRVVYNFEYCEGGWIEQRVDTATSSYATPPVTGVVVTDALNNYRLVNILKTRGWGDFTGVFPSHTPV